MVNYDLRFQSSMASSDAPGLDHVLYYLIGRHGGRLDGAFIIMSVIMGIVYGGVGALLCHQAI